jgi:hypothetical protein
MALSNKDAWLADEAGDLTEETVEGVPVKGQSVRVRALPAAYSNQATSEAMEMKQIGKEQIATVNTARLEVLQFAHGVIEPKFSIEEAEKIATKFASAWRKVIDKIDEISAIDKEAIEAAQARFPSSGSGEEGPDVENADTGGTGAGG